jgi:hypothetical protein
MIMNFKYYIFTIFFFCIACSKYETVELPSLNAKSFSYEEMMNKKDELEKRRELIHSNDMRNKQ